MLDLECGGVSLAQSSVTKAIYHGRLCANYSLAKHTSWRIGGLADYCYFPRDVEDLTDCFQGGVLPKPYLWLGLGSNVLIRDGGVRGTVIITQGCLQEMRADGTQRVYVQAGVTCAKFARFCARQGLTGAAFFAGIPGTMGGALAMNAGAFGGEAWEHIVQVDMIDECGRRHRHEADEFSVGYRCVDHHFSGWYIGAWFEFALGDVLEEKRKIRGLLKRRGESQPIGEWSCGSVFRNPPGGYAAALIEACGLKGLRRGGAVVSTKHANFIINDAGALASDVEALILQVQGQVERDTGVLLEPEVHLLGGKS
jgi:UDP-N-acetylmuramate dehydrogenase